MSDHAHIEQLRFARPYPDTCVMPATRLSLGHAIAHAERECVRHGEIRPTHVRVMVTELDDPSDPLDSLTIITTPRPQARHRPTRRRHGLLRRIWRRYR